MSTIYKTLPTEIKADASAESRAVTFTVSTGTVDRDGDVINPKGWQLDNYRKNPVVLFGHDYKSLPVAKATAITQTASGLVATAEFPAKGTYAFADTVYDMLKAGFLSATSVGFRPIKSQPHSETKGTQFDEQELLEFSIVPVPANSEALAIGRANRENAAILKSYAKQVGEWAAKQQEAEQEEPARMHLGAAKAGFAAKDAAELAAWYAEQGMPSPWNHQSIETFLIGKPMPKPSGNDDERTFMSRCMADPHMNEKYPDQKQRAAVCYQQYGAGKAELALIAKKPMDCPKGEACMKNDHEETCRAGSECPMLRTMPPKDEHMGGMNDGSGKAADEIVLEIADEMLEVNDEDQFLIEKTDVEAAVRSVLASGISELVRDEVRASWNRARGRVD